MKTFITSLTAIFLLLSISTRAQEAIYNFNDAIWTATNTSFPKGDFPSMIQNNVIFTNSMIYHKNNKGVKRVVMDKQTKHSSIVFPKFRKAKFATIECSSTADNQKIALEEMVDGRWIAVDEPIIVNKKLSKIERKLSKKATQIRIASLSNSYIYIVKVRIE